MTRPEIAEVAENYAALYVEVTEALLRRGVEEERARYQAGLAGSNYLYNVLGSRLEPDENENEDHDVCPLCGGIR